MKKAILAFISTSDDMGLFIARVMLGIVFIPHGSQKLLGLFGGYGFSGSMDYFIKSGMPAVLAFLIIMGESLGALALIAGFFGRFMASGIFLIMLGAVLMVHFSNGFFMNWFGNQKGEGFEYHLLAMGLALVIMVRGSGKFSLDMLIHKYFTKN
jgi:putative oxidoreductase